MPVSVVTVRIETVANAGGTGRACPSDPDVLSG